MDAGASLSERLTHISAQIDTQPANANSARLPGVGVTQPSGAITAPSTEVPMNCDVASTMSGVARNARVTSISTENERLPASAIIAGQVTLWAEGCIAISTPQKPATIALQRRQPIRSRSTMAESAATNTGQAR